MILKRTLLLCLMSSFLSAVISHAFASSSHPNMAKSLHKRQTRSIFTLYDSVTPSTVPIHWFSNVSSTMDKGKILAKGLYANYDVFAVTADHQSKGRGTRGRGWSSGQKNMFLTVVVKQSLVPIPLNFLPLRIGTIVGSAISSRVLSGATVKLKWPNDILIDDKKACGILIEIEGGRVFVGIGCNVLSAPEVPASGKDGGRQSTCIAAHNPVMLETTQQQRGAVAIGSALSDSSNGEQCSATDADSDPGSPLVVGEDDFHLDLAREISTAVANWVASQNDSPSLVLRDFQHSMDRAPQRLRDASNNASPDGEEVLPLGLDADGTLQVKISRTGEVRTLLADYLW